MLPQGFTPFSSLFQAHFTSSRATKLPLLFTIIPFLFLTFTVVPAAILVSHLKMVQVEAYKTVLGSRPDTFSALSCGFVAAYSRDAP